MGTSVGQRQAGGKIAVKVNGTVYGASTTGSDGSFSGTLTLPAVDDKPTNYQIEIVFYGDNGFNLIGYAHAPDGTGYAVCSTVQYFPYKPAANSTWITVDPHSIEVMLATKTPEEMQEQAKNNGWLSIWHEWSWFYPWYRLHVKININQP
jgi:hypothetical protein